MNKDELKRYLNEAVEALTPGDLEQLFPQNNQPDLYTLAQELIGLRGEIKKLAQSSLKINNSVQTFITKQNDLAPVEEKKQSSEEELLKQLLNLLLDQDDHLKRTAAQLSNAPEIKFLKLKEAKHFYANWKQGYEISMSHWDNFIKSLGLYKTGMEGQQFDPQYHEAIAVKHIPEKENNLILETEILGYIYKQKLIRQAKVVVNKL